MGDSPTKKCVDANEALLVEKAAAGDRQAFEALVSKYLIHIISYLHSFVGDFHEAEDLAQEVFIKAYRSIGVFRVETPFQPWLFTIARNTARDYWRWKKRRPLRVDLPEDLASENPSLVDQDETQNRVKAVEKAIAALPVKERTALVLCCYEEKSYREIAEIMNCTLGMVKKLVHEARQKLRKRSSQTGTREDTGGNAM